MTDIEGVAISFSADPDSGECNWDIIKESDYKERPPHVYAEGLIASCTPDFPNRLWTFTVNDRARMLMGTDRTRRMLGDEQCTTTGRRFGDDSWPCFDKQGHDEKHTWED